jgi:hypothetical protein
MKKVVINFAVPGREDYLSAQNRLIDSFKAIVWDGDFLMFSTHERQHNGVDIIDAHFRDHADVPYGFKLDAFLYALNAGYRKIIWVDSTVIPLKNLEPLFEHADKNGVTAFHNLGHNLHQYISDEATEYFNLDEKDPDFENIQQIMLCALVLDFENEVTGDIFEDWGRASDAGMFKDGGSVRKNFKAHRHDQAALSAILHEYGVPLLPYGKLVYEPHEITKEFGNDIYLLNKAI